ncbi:cytochrome c3 family protein [Sporomusa acidovorans]|uniref:Tetrahaem cytochrome domain-containing protein n=1 Tax=Sporomusa acidovorans (strain ATCC 49682 / DSM 3132 / Mol) TaxID=1123286 RepID=A0ABZ3J6Q8_SPOA4|nr:cytochrome c3 family protein [Sporomusa acidovorans]OZC21009.1 fumarate reductase flavoprotein subunit precursor [Sporomusa acidovorans DSM 3132]SDF18496.1 Tetraheme cytochrome c subunit of nitrate or TMAO reductase [Sporomusa acidovorans]
MENKTQTSIKEIVMQKKVIYVIILLVLIAAGGMIAMAKASDKPEFCTSCHNMQSYYDSWHDGNLLAKKHADAGVNCHDCHQPSLTQQMDEGLKYVTDNFDDPMPKRQFSNEFCTKCHNMEDVKAKTLFDDKNGKVNPHDAHVGQQNCYECHSMHRESKLSCTECHTPQWLNKLPDYWKKTN